MMQSGTVVNGMVVLDGPTKLPEGSRVDVLLSVDGDDIGAPPDVGAQGDIVSLVREAHADVLAGRTRPLADSMADLRAKLLAPGGPKDR